MESEQQNAAEGVSFGEDVASSSIGSPQQSQITADVRAKLGEIRGRIEVSVGQAVLQMMQLPRYRHQTLGDLNHLMVEPLLRDRLAIAFAKDGEGSLTPNSAPVGIAIWASVSDAVHSTIKEQVKAGTFPIRLKPDDWASGEHFWLLDIVAGNRKAASAVLANFKSIAGEQQVHLHPIVARAVDPDLLGQLKQS